ncbi:MAG: TlpA family protein disulfide reductase [Oligoflexales bacterium]
MVRADWKNIFLTLLIVLNTKVYAASCPRVSFEQLKAATRDLGKVKLVFFASWCVSCKPHLLEPHDKKTVFVAAFDEEQRAEKVLKAFSVEGLCFTSDDTAQKLGVTALPATRVIDID